MKILTQKINHTIFAKILGIFLVCLSFKGFYCDSKISYNTPHVVWVLSSNYTSKSDFIAHFRLEKKIHAKSSYFICTETLFLPVMHQQIDMVVQKDFMLPLSTYNGLLVRTTHATIYPDEDASFLVIS